MHFTYCPHVKNSVKRKKIFLGKIAPRLNQVNFCVDCERSCKYTSIEKNGDQFYVRAEPVYQHRIDPYLDPDLFDDEGLEIE